jgi:hypothetical protein
MAVKGRSADFKTPIARLSFADGLFKARPKNSKNPDGPKFWTCSLLYPKTSDMSAIQKAVLEAAEQAWPGKVENLVKTGLLKNPILDGDGPQGVNKKKGERYDGYAGHHFLRVSSGFEHRPRLVNQQVLPITDASELYSGCFVIPYIHAFAWESDEQPYGVSFGISMLQKARDGEKIGGGGGVGNPEDVFDKISDEGAAPEETKSGKGAGGLFG